MKRWISSVVLGVLLGLSGPALAQEGDYPPDTVGSGITLLGGQFDPGGTGSITYGETAPDTAHGGTVFSAPIPMPVTSSDGNGVLPFSGFAVPEDFALAAVHSSEVTLADGSLLASFEFCVNAAGTITSEPLSTCGPAAAVAGGGGGPLARTGTDLILDGLRVAAAAIGLGALALFWHRRRLRAHDGGAIT